MSNWNNIIGHEWAVQLLSDAITHDRIGHAYLITGPEQIGKTLLALTFAQALNCTHPQERPCGQCRTCQLIANNRHPDIRFIEPTLSSRGKASIKIDTIRELQRDLNLAAYEANYKIAILKRFDTANINAANAFLKTLEEPPKHVILLLTANDADTVLSTINSRCRVIPLRPTSTSRIETALQNQWQLPADKANLLAHLADGRIGWAIQAHTTPQLLQTRQEQLTQLYQILDGQRVARFAIAENLSRKPEHLADRIQTWLSWWRDLTILTQTSNTTPPLAIRNIDEQAQLNQHHQNITSQQALASLKQTNLALWQLQRNANIRLVLENLFLTYPIPSPTNHQ